MKKIYILALAVGFLMSCSSDFLEIKRDKSQAIPETLEEFDLMLANNTVLNNSSGNKMTSIMAEEFNISKNAFDLITVPEERNAYLFKDEPYMGIESVDWNYSYKRVLYCNIVLEGLEKLDGSQRANPAFSRIKGEALFHRAKSFFILLQQFGALFGDSQNDRYGIPIILKNEPAVPSKRATVTESYRTIVDDLIAASEILPLVSLDFYRPNKTAAYALLARVFLFMGKYDEALNYADRALSIRNNLVDYNTLSATNTYSFPSGGVGNDEIIHYDISYYALVMLRDRYRVSQSLYDTYETGDLRKTLFFTAINNEGYYFRGSYSGAGDNFTGLATDELYLIKAESLIRADRVDYGLDALNTLLITRYSDPALFVPATAADKEAALNLVLLERRKQLLNRGVRWSDLRRLNRYDNKNIVLQRTFDGKTYQLEANSLKYMLLIPYNVIENSAVLQSIR